MKRWWWSPFGILTYNYAGETRNKKGRTRRTRERERERERNKFVLTRLVHPLLPPPQMTAPLASSSFFETTPTEVLQAKVIQVILRTAIPCTFLGVTEKEDKTYVFMKQDYDDQTMEWIDRFKLALQNDELFHRIFSSCFCDVVSYAMGILLETRIAEGTVRGYLHKGHTLDKISLRRYIVQPVLPNIAKCYTAAQPTKLLQPQDIDDLMVPEHCVIVLTSSSSNIDADAGEYILDLTARQYGYRSLDSRLVEVSKYISTTNAIVKNELGSPIEKFRTMGVTAMYDPKVAHHRQVSLDIMKGLESFVY